MSKVLEKFLMRLSSRGTLVSKKPAKNFIRKLYAINVDKAFQEEFPLLAKNHFSVKFVSCEFIDFIQDSEWYVQVNLVDEDGLSYTIVWRNKNVEVAQ